MKRNLVLVFVVLALLLTACAQPATPQVVEKEVIKTVIVEKEVPVEKKVVETVIVEKEVVVEKVVKETVVVEKEVLVTPKPSRPLVIGLPQEPDTLGKLFIGMKASREVMVLIEREIFEINDEFAYYPILVEETPTVANDLITILPDGRMEITYKFKKGLKWADGVEITTDDAMFHHQMMLDTNMPYSASKLHQEMEFEAIDKYTLVVRGKPSPFAEFSSVSLLPKHYVEPILKEHIESGAADYGIKFSQDERIARKPLSNGPYKVEEWAPGDHITLKRNENYNLGPMPTIDTIIVRFITDLNTLATNVITGDVDVTTQIGLGMDQGLQIEKDAPNVQVFFRPMWNIEIFQLYHDVPPLNDVRVRQALVYAIDREDLVENLFYGKYVVAATYFPVTHPNYNANCNGYPYDPEKAEQLLAEAGYTPGPGGKLVDANGEPLHIVYQTTAGNTERERSQQVIKAHWEAIGIEVEIKNELAKTFFGETFRRLQIPGQVLMWAIQNTPSGIGYIPSYCEPIATKENDWVGSNLYHFCDEQYKEVADKLSGAVDADERARLQKEIQCLHQDKLPVVPLYMKPKILTASKSLQNFKPDGFYAGWNVHEWVLAE